MRTTRTWAFATSSALLGSALLICCGTDEGLGPNDTPRGDLIGGERNSNEAGLGSGAQTSGGEPAGSGGTLGGSGGATAGSGGTTTSVAGQTGDGGATPSAGGAGGAGGVGEVLELCARISQKTIHAQDVSREYAKNAYAHCDSYWIIRLAVDDGEGLAQYRNDLAAWSYSFWGCGAEPATTFGLVYGTPAISAGDAKLLIDTYIEAAKFDLDMSPGEVTEMRSALERLSRLVVVDDSTAPSRPNSHPDCAGAGGAGAGGASSEGGAGGAGGADGTPNPDPGSAGHGGVP
jgi:hypothetical protein